MTHQKDLSPERKPGSVDDAVAQSETRAASLKAQAEAAAKEVSIWMDLQSYRSKQWWFHLRALFEREAKFFSTLRESEAPVIGELEGLFRQAKTHTDELLHELPRNIEQMAEQHGLALDHSRSAHPKYQFREGFLTLEIDGAKRIARLKDYEEKLAEMPPDIEAIARSIKQHDERLFGRSFDGAQFLEKLRRNYLALIKKEGKQDGDPIPLRKVARRVVDNERNYRRDEFLIDLSRLAADGPPATGGYGFEFQQTKDTEQGFLLHGPAGRGMVNLLIFKKVSP
jgi:hypothetical protein